MAATPEQFAVILHRNGHLLVPAVPGSGKTFAMVERVISLLQEGVAPHRLLVMMFNVSARADFKERLLRRSKDLQLPMPEVQTFHAFGLKLCKAMESRGYLPVYKLEDESWVFQRMARAAIALANEGLADEDKIPLESENIEELLELVEYAKNELAEISKDGLPHVSDGYIDAIKHFENLRHDHKLRSFTDLLYDPAVLIQSNDDIKRWVGNRYDHLIGDEAQDMNQLQICLMSWVAGTRAQVCIVGDEDQSIYEWRGSRPEFMVRLFEQQFQNATRLPLTRTFRYGHSIALMANHVIQKNQMRMDKLCIPGTDQHTDIELIQTQPGKDGDEVKIAVERWVADGRGIEECAVLVREYSHTVAIETAFLEARIPYKIVGAPPFFQRREALALRGALLLAGAGLDSIEDQDTRKNVMQAMLSVPTCYLRREMIEQLAQQKFASGGDFIDAIATLSADKNLSSGTRRKLGDRAAAWRKAITVAGARDAGTYLDTLIDSLDMKEAIFNESGKPETAFARWRTVVAIKDLAIDHQVSTQDMVGFLDELHIRYDQMSSAAAVLVTSIHRAKGLEWPHVIVPGLKEGSFPSYDITEGLPEDLMEAERRLYYVAVTRARQRLSLIAPNDRQLLSFAASGNYHPPENTDFYASRFLYESNLHWSKVIADELDGGGLHDGTMQLLSQREGRLTGVFNAYLKTLSA